MSKRYHPLTPELVRAIEVAKERAGQVSSGVYFNDWSARFFDHLQSELRELDAKRVDWHGEKP